MIACKRKGKNFSPKLEEMSVGRGLGVPLVAGVDKERRKERFHVRFPSHTHNTRTHACMRGRGEEGKGEKERITSEEEGRG